MTTTTARTATHHTLNCVEGNHERCHGYVAPRNYGGCRPCECSCHDDGTGHPRDYAAAAAQADRSTSD